MFPLAVSTANIPLLAAPSPAKLPSSSLAITGTPFTSTYSIPTESRFGSSYVALSVIFSGSKTTTSPHIPRFSTPRSVSRIRCAGSAENFRIASASVSSFSSAHPSAESAETSHTPAGADVRSQQPLRRCPLRIVVNRHPRLLQSQHHIRLVHAEHRNLGERLVLDQQIHSASIASSCHSAATSESRLPCSGKSSGSAPPQSESPRAPNFLPLVVPVLTGRVLSGARHVLANPRPHRSILSLVNQLSVPAVMRPRRNEAENVLNHAVYA